MFNQNNTPEFVCYPKQTVENFQDITVVGTSKNIIQESNQSSGFVTNQSSGFVTNQSSGFVTNQPSGFSSNIISEIPKFTSNIISEVSSSSTFGFGNPTPVSSSLSSSTSFVDGKISKNICIDNTCLTEEDLKKLLKMIKNLPN